MCDFKSKVDNLKKVMEKYRGKRLLIVLRGAPDPDSISSALAHKRILESWGIDSLILYYKMISHQENLALINLLEIDLTFYSEGFSFDEFAGVCLVDSQCADKFIIPKVKHLPVVSIVDHHDISSNSQARFTDIRKDVGSAATIYARYLQVLDLLKSDSDNNYSVNLATALMHGIRTDTNSFFMARENDFRSLVYLSRFYDPEMLEKIAQRNMSPVTMDLIFKAYKGREITDSFLISSVGLVKEENRDAIPQAADFLLLRSGIDTVLVYGIVGNYIDGSLRTSSDIVQPEKFIINAYPDVGIDGEYGGRSGKGGFRLPLGIFKSMAGENDRTLLIDLVDRYMKNQFYAKIGAEPVATSLT